jgi:hypothetical protein
MFETPKIYFNDGFHLYKMSNNGFALRFVTFLAGHFSRVADSRRSHKEHVQCSFPFPFSVSQAPLLAHLCHSQQLNRFIAVSPSTRFWLFQATFFLLFFYFFLSAQNPGWEAYFRHISFYDTEGRLITGGSAWSGNDSGEAHDPSDAFDDNVSRMQSEIFFTQDLLAFSPLSPFFAFQPFSS